MYYSHNVLFSVFVLSYIGFQVGFVKEQANCGEEDRLRHFVTGCWGKNPILNASL